MRPLNQKLHRIIVILGPTASGKSSLAFELAKKYDGELVSADSRQIYKHMDIGTAKDIGEWIGKQYVVDGIPLHLVDFVDPADEFSVANYRQLAYEKIDDILSRGKLPIIVGGTGLYVQAIVDNLAIPEVAPNEEIRKELQGKTLEELQEEYRQLDPEGFELIDEKNPVRLIRAIEVCRQTGKKFSDLRKKGEPRYDAMQIGIDWDREDLYGRIDKRVDIMVEQGLFEEAQGLIEKGYSCDLQAMNSIGYAEVCRFTQDELSESDATEEIKKNSRHYAKRQATWFLRDKRINWVKPSEFDSVDQRVDNFLKN